MREIKYSDIGWTCYGLSYQIIASNHQKRYITPFEWFANIPKTIGPKKNLMPFNKNLFFVKFANLRL